MNIEFTLSAKSFLEAAEFEEILNNNNIQYSIDGKLNGKRASNPRPSKRKKRVSITKTIIRQIMKDKKSKSVDKLASEYNVSRSTIGRVIAGTHTLQQ